jgi:shikimate dehydrogenase
VSKTVPKACVIGDPVAHSRSPMLHGYWLETLGLPGAYVRERVTAPEFEGFIGGLRRKGYVGANITIPHKEAAFRAVTRRDEAAQAIGAVNTVWYEGDTLIGGNTDAYGFEAHLDATIPDWARDMSRAVILGAGGAARAVVHALLDRGIEVALVNRTLPRAHELAGHFGGRPSVHSFDATAQLVATADMLVNTTSLGMAGKDALALDLSLMKAGTIVYDVVYVPVDTTLLRSARQAGLRTVDGLGMLLHQAVPGFAKWFGVTPAVTPELRALIEADITKST